MIVLWVGIACPVALYAVGAWLETLGTIEGLADEFYTRWPFAAIGCALGVLTLTHVWPAYRGRLSPAI